jgi:Na+/H+ antiporter NhaC
MSEHPFGWLSLLPPLTAIALAITTRRVIASLLAGVVVGCVILSGGRPLLTIYVLCEQQLWVSLTGVGHLRVFVFTALMGAMVGVMQRAGGMESIVRGLAPLARTRRGGQLTIWLLGLVVFFDDYANSLLLGNTMRPLADRLKISREKLAYLVDSTAAPVAGLALISTWIAGEIGFIRDGLASIGLTDDVDGFDLFLETIPYRFYVLWALLLVPIVAVMGRDFGAMWTAEQDVLRSDTPPPPSANAAQDRAASWLDAALPVVAVVAVTMGLIFLTGAAKMSRSGSGSSLLDLLGNGDSYLALVYGALAGLGCALVLARGKGVLTASEASDAAMSGARHVLPALAILWLAWTLSQLTGEEFLGTGHYLAEMLQRSLDVRWLPTAVFLLAAAVSFATGTSWGTMGILMPLVVAVAYRMLLADEPMVSPHHPLMVATIGSVLAGAIFGDHCSPISDTTVLSSQASGCDHIAHVRTQMPYAAMVAFVSVVSGTIPVGFGVNVWLLVPLGIPAMILMLRWFGKRVE